MILKIIIVIWYNDIVNRENLKKRGVL